MKQYGFKEAAAKIVRELLRGEILDKF